MKIIGYADIIIPSLQTIIDVKTSVFEHPKLEHLLQIILYGMLTSNITKYVIYNPIYGVKYEWIQKNSIKSKVSNVRNELIDYISSILPELKKKQTYFI
jgi:hypothetical protein